MMQARDRNSLIVLVVAFIAVGAHAQIAVECQLAHSRVLLFEPIWARITIENNTGHALNFTGENANARLGFQIEHTPGVPVPATNVPLLEQPLKIEPGRTQVVDVNILPRYLIRSTGPYTVRARVEWGDQAFLSNKSFLDVLPGFDVGSLTVALADSAASRRTFTLKTLAREQKELLFLRLDDQASGRCLGVIELGRIVRQFKPQMMADGRGAVHILHQSSPWRFSHTVVSVDGVVMSTRDFNASLPEARLEALPDGRVTVRGELRTGAGAQPDRPFVVIEPRAP